MNRRRVSKPVTAGRIRRESSRNLPGIFEGLSGNFRLRIATIWRGPANIEIVDNINPDEAKYGVVDSHCKLMELVR